MVSASALAKRPEKLIAATVAADFLSSDRREVVMVFLPDFTASAAVFLLGLSVFGELVGKSTLVPGNGGAGALSRGSVPARMPRAGDSRPSNPRGSSHGLTERRPRRSASPCRRLPRQSSKDGCGQKTIAGQITGRARA